MKLHSFSLYEVALFSTTALAIRARLAMSFLKHEFAIWGHYIAVIIVVGAGPPYGSVAIIADLICIG